MDYIKAKFCGAMKLTSAHCGKNKFLHITLYRAYKFTFIQISGTLASYIESRASRKFCRTHNTQIITHVHLIFVYIACTKHCSAQNTCIH